NQIITGTGGTLPGGVSAFKRGIWVNEAQGIIGGTSASQGNNVTGFIQDMLVAFSRGATNILHNQMNWAGLTITEPNANAPIDVANNQFSSVAVPDDASVLIKH